MPNDPNRISRLIESISDGERIDWQDEEESAANDGERQQLRLMRVVSVIATYHGQGGLNRGDRLGWFEILSLSGSGAYGDVYRARDLKLDREVAIKILRDPGWLHVSEGHDVPRYLAEARRLARIRHPNVVTIHSVDPLPLPSGVEVPALVMEFIEGESLADIVSRQGPMSGPEIAAAGVELCGALAAVHAAGLVHQDLKPQNVRRERGGRIVLMDFGPGGATPLAMAPELFDTNTATPRSDIYGLGVILYHLATGSYPVRGKSVAEIQEGHRQGKSRRLRDERPDLPSGLVQTISRALEADPGRRFGSAGEFESALLALSGPKRRIAWPLAAGAALALIAAALLFVPWKPAAPPGRVVPDATVPAPRADAPSAGGPAAAAPVYTLQAGFYRGGSQRELLEQGAWIAPGDSISLRIRASLPVHVYVVDEDEIGAAFLLFPSPNFSPGNPLPASVDQRIPNTEDGREAYWRVTSAGGREHLLLIVSPHPLENLDRDLASLPRPSKDRPVSYAHLGTKEIETLRGLGGYVEGSGREAAAQTQRLFELAAVLPEQEETTNGVWIRRIDLVNPGE